MNGVVQCVAGGGPEEGDRASLRRGACPSLAAPMKTGDGLLVRLRPQAPGFSLAELSVIAKAAAMRGNGILEVTARGNLQIRGLTAASAQLLATDIFRADIAIADGLAIEAPPLAGLDPGEIADPSALVGQLRQALAARPDLAGLAPKLSIIIDGGGRLHLGALTADIRLQAVRRDGGVRWLLSVAGTMATAQPVGLLEGDHAIGVLIRILDMLKALGATARGRDLDIASLRREMPLSDHGSHVPSLPAASYAGIHDFGDGRIVLGAGLAFGQVRAEQLLSLIDGLEILGAREMRPAPDHGFLVVGLSAANIEAARALALGHGLRVFSSDPRNAISACAGAGACASAEIDTHAVARILVEAAPDLLDGSASVHVSGCAKGCAHPSASALTITAAPIGYGFVVNGAASAEPVVYIEENKMKSAVERLGAIVRERKRTGESAGSCLTRLGPEAIAAAVR